MKNLIRLMLVVACIGLMSLSARASITNLQGFSTCLTASVGVNGDTGIVSVVAAATCDWEAVSDSAWLTITDGDSGTGDGTVSFTVATNLLSARVGTITVNDLIFTITQSGGCSYVISPGTNNSFTAPGGMDLFTVTPSGGNCAWTAATNVSWLTVTSGLSGTGTNTVTYTVATNTAGTSRTGLVTVASLNHMVVQAGDTAAPVATLTAPTNGQTISGTFALTATATDAIGVTNVNFYTDGSLSGSDTSSPYSYSLDTTSLTNGSHTIFARGYDAGGNVGVSTTNTITVTNVASTDSWIVRGGGTMTDQATATATDSSGNVYYSGWFSGTSTSFGPSNLVSTSSFDIFLVKYSSSGVFQWAKKFGGSGGDKVYAMAIDASDNIWITGSFYGINFGGSALNSAGGTDIFLAKFNSSGVHQFSAKYGGIYNDEPRALSLDGAGNVLLAGFFAGTVNFGGSNITTTKGMDSFLAKFNSSGVHQWSKSFTVTADNVAYSVAASTNGTVFLAGGSLGTINFGTSNLVSAGGYDVYLAKFDSGGTNQWAARFGGTGDDRASGVAVNKEGTVVGLAGFFSGTATFASSNFVSSGSSDIFVAKFNGSGTLGFARKFGSANSEAGNAVVVDPSDNIIAVGDFQGTINFGGGNLVAASKDGFAASYTSTGTHNWSYKLGGGAATDTALGVASDSNGKIGVAGYYTGSGTFPPGTVTNAGGFDAFLLRIAP